jgi:DNA-binding MarR family transcriptional regulator
VNTDLHQLLGDLFAVSHRLTRVAARAAGGKESPAVWRTLSVLSGTGPMRLGELAELSRVSQPTATNLVATLVARGWVERQADASDARVSVIRITPGGEEALAEWRDALATAMLPLFSSLPESDLETLEKAVTIMRERVVNERGITT